MEITGPDKKKRIQQPGFINFGKLIDNNEVYVDKTGLIRKLLTDEYKIVILNRPRMFGKSLLLSTIEHILKGDKDKFGGLDIGNPDNGYDWRSSHVIRLDMSKYGATSESIDFNLSAELQDFADDLGFKLNRTGSGPSIAGLVEKLYNKFRKIPISLDGIDISADIPQVSVLIDEYDFPLAININDHENLAKIQKFMAIFYASLKAVSDKIRHLIITGVTQFNELLTFSGMNNFTDITFDPKYSTICGFTADEIRSYYEPIVKQIFDKLKNGKYPDRPKSLDDMFAMILDWYDGYSWDGITKVLNPHSVLSFCKYKGFARYWYDTAGPGFLQKLQIKDEDFFRNFSNNSSFKAAVTYQQTKTISPESSLLATGYLTVAKAEGNSDGFADKTFELTIPNVEVRISYAQDYLLGKIYPDISNNDQLRFKDLAVNFCSLFCDTKADASSDLLSSLLASIPYDHHTASESFYKSHLSTIFAFAQGMLSIEPHVGDGRPDFLIETRKQYLIIEVKYHKSYATAANRTLDNPSGIPQNDGETATADDPGKTITDALPRQNRKPKRITDEQLLKLLDDGIADAFDQISDNDYVLGFLHRNKKVWGVAISIVGRTGVKIKFKAFEML